MESRTHPESSKPRLQSPRNLVQRLGLVVLDSERNDIGSERPQSSSHGELRDRTSIDFERLSVAGHDVRERLESWVLADVGRGGGVVDEVRRDWR